MVRTFLEGDVILAAPRFFKELFEFRLCLGSRSGEVRVRVGVRHLAVMVKVSVGVRECFCLSGSSKEQKYKRVCMCV